MPAHAYFRVESCMSCRERLRLRLHLSISLSNNAVTGRGALVLADLAHSRSLHAPGSNCPEAAFGITPCYIFCHGTKEAAGKPGCTPSATLAFFAAAPMEEAAGRLEGAWHGKG